MNNNTESRQSEPVVLFNVDEGGKLVDFGLCRNDYECGAYLIRQAELALDGAYIPKETVYCQPDPEWTDERLSGLLHGYISRNDIECMSSLDLRSLTFIHETVEGGLSDNMYSILLCLEKLTDDFNTYGLMQEYDTFHEKKANHISARTVSAIETDRGILLFNDSGRGLHCLDCCLQFHADNYFSPDFRNMNELNLYHFSTTNAEVVRKANECAYMFTPDGECQFIHSLARYLPKELVSEINPAQSCTTSKDMSSFHTFLSRFCLKETEQTREIAVLTEIRYRGITAEQMEKLSVHRNSFGRMYDRLQRYVSMGDSVMYKALQQSVMDKAAQILRSEYDVRQRVHTFGTNERNITEKPDNPDKRKNCNRGLKI